MEYAQVTQFILKLTLIFKHFQNDLFDNEQQFTAFTFSRQVLIITTIGYIKFFDHLHFTYIWMTFEDRLARVVVVVFPGDCH